jgi:peptidoglycan/LPS O-acetylase OafA/YrhL
LGGLGEKGTIYGSLVSIGWSGVDLFFVLSGFLITGILLDSRSEGKYFKKFYARRILRIFPLYYAVVASVFVAGPFILANLSRNGLPATKLHPESQLFAWTFTLNIPFGFDTQHVSSLIHPLWSVSVEEQFYLFWPLVVYLLRPQDLRRLCLALVGTALAIRIVFSMAGNGLAAYVFTPCRFDALALGALLALTLRTPGGMTLAKQWASRFTVVAFVGVAIIVFLRGTLFTDPVVSTVGLSLIAILYASALACVLATPLGSALRRPFCITPLRLLGKYSYATYVFHQFIIVGLVAMGISSITLASRLHSKIWGDLAFGAIAGATTLGCAVASWWLFEKRFLSLKRAFSYDNASTPQVDVT